MPDDPAPLDLVSGEPAARHVATDPFWSTVVRRHPDVDVDRSWHTNAGDAHGSYFNNDTESLYNIGRIVDGQGDVVNEAAQSYDPWYGPPVDPETDREPTENEAGRSNTTDRRENPE